MSSEQKAIIALINRSMMLIQDLNEQKKVSRELEARLAEAHVRIAELEKAVSGDEGPPRLRVASA